MGEVWLHPGGKYFIRFEGLKPYPIVRRRMKEKIIKLKL